MTQIRWPLALEQHEASFDEDEWPVARMAVDCAMETPPPTRERLRWSLLGIISLAVAVLGVTAVLWGITQ
jgi:hypothetical protein